MEGGNGPEALGDVLGRLFVARGWGRLRERLKLEAAWQAAAGDAIAGQTRVSRIRRGVLEVEVRSTVLLAELAQFHKRTILKKLRETVPNQAISDLKFRAGSW